MSVHTDRMSLRIPALAFALTAVLAVSPVMAKQDNEKGGGNPNKSEQAGKKGGDEQHGKSHHTGKSSDAAKGHNAGKSHDAVNNHGKGGGKAVGKAGTNFDDRQRNVLRNYFQTEFKRGSCPPGLAKKHNGCMPPGQAKKWRVGHRLPPDVIFYDLPGWVLRDLGPAPVGHRYVRVDGDVLLLALGTSLVIDALSAL